MSGRRRPVRVGLIHPLRTWLQALAVVLGSLDDLQIVVANADPRWIHHAAARNELDVVVARLDEATGVAEVAELRRAHATLGVVVIGDVEDATFSTEVIRAGARGYLAEDCSIDVLHRAVLGVADGETWLAPAHLTHVLEGLLSQETTTHASDDRLAGLSSREREILGYLAQGLQRKEIAELLYISPHTVRTHVNHLIKKLQVHSALAAVTLSQSTNQSTGGHSENGPTLPQPRRGEH